MEQPEQKQKKPYKSPKVAIYGTLEDMTRGVGNTGDDGFLGSRNKA
jgi:hypothetical protein